MKNIHTLCLYNTFKKRIEQVTLGLSRKVDVRVNHEFSSRLTGTVYCCGPTVYDHSHLGHAFTYTRFDLFRRVMSMYCNTDLVVGMGITDIDDKIIKKAQSESTETKHFFTVGQKYFNSFLEDIEALNISKPHFFLRVTDHVNDIINYIRMLQEKEFAYINPETGDVVFDTSHLESYAGATDDGLVTSKSVGKRSPRDFVLWKCSKPGEPTWNYVSPSGAIIPGRPGWHVECSAMAGGVFGSSVDFHFGGKDLVFPHHYNESACCHAFLGLEGPVYGWSRYWLHSGHLIFNQNKMSKSLGNVVTIKEFLRKENANILRLFCIRVHYRSDFVFSEKLLEDAKAFDSKLKQFVYMLQSELKSVSIAELRCNEISSESKLSEFIDEIELEIVRGVADDLDLGRGLTAVLNLYKQLLSTPNRTLQDLSRAKFLLERWVTAMGLNYRLDATLSGMQSTENHKVSMALDLVAKFRADIRDIALKRLKYEKKNQLSSDDDKIGSTLLSALDKLRADLIEQGITVEDPPRR